MDKAVQKNGSVKSIDIHAHIIPSMEAGEKYKGSMPRISRDSLGRDILIIEGKPPFAISKPLFDVDLRIKEMDETNVDMQVLSIMPPLIQYNIEPNFASAIAGYKTKGLRKSLRHSPRGFWAWQMFHFKSLWKRQKNWNGR